MPINILLKRASSLLGLSPEERSVSQYGDGDIVYCKNNVCVHTPSQFRSDGTDIHHPGYMVIKCVSSVQSHMTLNLTWIPNDRLKKNHDLIYNGLKNDDEKFVFNYRRDSDSDTLSITSLPVQTKSKEAELDGFDSKSMIITSADTDLNFTIEESFETDSFGQFTTSSVDQNCILEGDEDGEVPNFIPGCSQCESNVCDIHSIPMSIPSKGSPRKLNSDSTLETKLQNCSIHNRPAVDQSNEQSNFVSSSSDSEADKQRKGGDQCPDTSESEERPHSGSTEAGKSGEESEEEGCSVGSPCTRFSPKKYFTSNAREDWFNSTAESMAVTANLTFPESPSTSSSYGVSPTDGADARALRKKHKCSNFSVDLGQMKSLRLFFSDKEKTRGQLVIASLESQYKILHFHCGGLDKLARVFENWNFLTTQDASTKEPSDIHSGLKQFSVCRPEINESELHPEEGTLEYLDAETWLTYFSEDGSIEDDLTLRRTVFFGGVEPQIRRNVWPFLLHYYDFRTTFLERQNVMQEKHQSYWLIDSSRKSLSGSEKERFWKEVQCTVEKDVVRTDRTKRCFAGPDNPNLEKMKNILLNFAHHHKDIGYTQGMSDILAPILAEVRNEEDVFWCFTGMMSKTIFVTSPNDKDMEKNLNYLCELMRIMVPGFYDYVKQQDDGLDLLFCHRWILLCFKREFSEDEALAMWEACWSNYQTDYFHLFLVVSIVSIYGLEVVTQAMRSDEMLLYFTSLANHMDGSLVLKKGRGLLNQFRTKSSIPCSLVGLCELCGPGQWDSGHAPTVECACADNDLKMCRNTHLQTKQLPQSILKD